MKRAILFLSAGILSFMISCTTNPTANSGFSNKLTLGMGMNMSNFSLVNEGTAFARLGSSVTIYFRLESASDMAGSNVTIKIEKQASGSWAADTSFAFVNPQSYGHLLLSSFSLSDAGYFRATGILATGNSTVAAKEFTVQ